MKKWGLFSITILFFGIISCVKQSPQIPSNKITEIDNDRSSLLKINGNLIRKEDSLLAIIAKKKGSFKKNNIGFWYQIFNTGKGESIADSSLCKFDYQLFKINDKFIQSGQKTIIIGKKQSIIGLEEGLKMMHKGDSATFIIPWYLAYGMTGDDNLILPYTSLIYKLKVTI